MDALLNQGYQLGQLDDRTIVKRIVAGERELFEILLRRYNQTLYRVMRSYLRDEDEVQDAMQNAYLKAFDKLYQFQGSSAFSTWLIRIGINEALVRLKDIRRTKTISLRQNDLGADIINQIPDKQMNAEKNFIRQESVQILEKAIDNLPEKYRVVYMLKEVEGLDNAAIAETLGLSESNMKVRLHRAKSLLKESLFKQTVQAEAFEFGNSRCDAIVDFVMRRI